MKRIVGPAVILMILAVPMIGAGTLVAAGKAGATGPEAVQTKVGTSKVVTVKGVKCTWDSTTHDTTASGTVIPKSPGTAIGNMSATLNESQKRTATAVTMIGSLQLSGAFSLSGSVASKPTTCRLVPAFAAPTATRMASYFASKGLPVTGIITYNATTDPNHLLGRPTGYLSKAAWADTRIAPMPGVSAGDVSLGGSAEVFATSTLATKRAQYLTAIESAAPILGSEYDYLLGPVLVRISGQLTPQQAAGYQAMMPGAQLYKPS